MAQQSLLVSCELCGLRDVKENIISHQESCRSSLRTQDTAMSKTENDAEHVAMTTTSPPDGVTTREAAVKKQKVGEEEEEDDPISQAIGEFGRWQLKLTFLLSLFNIPCTWHIFATTFQSPSVIDFWCARPPHLHNMSVPHWRNISHPSTTHSDGSITYDACLVWDEDSTFDLTASNRSTRPCTVWEFNNEESGDTIIAEWNLVCDRAELGNVAEMMFLAGVALGGLVSGMVSDRFGRKKTLMGSLVLQICIAMVMSFAPWFELYLVLRCCLGFISVSVVFSGFVLCMEIVGGKWRTISGVSYLFPVPLSYITIAGIAYFVKGWKKLQMALTLPTIILFGLWWVLPESPRWLLALGRKDEVMAILQEASKANKRPLPQNIDKIIQQGMTPKGNSDQPKAGIVDLFRTPNMRKNSLVLYVIWFSVYLVYYGLVLNLNNIGGNVYVNTVVSGVVEIPAIAISIVILLKMGRRWPLCLTLVGSGVACLLTLTVPRGKDHLEWITITLAMIGKFSVSSSNAVMPVFTAELFPTVVRNLGVGSSNVSAGIALMLVPYLWNLTSVDQCVPMVVLGVCGLVGGLSVLMLPETADQPLVGSLEEGEEIPRRASIIEKQRKRSSAGNCNSSYAIE